MATNAETKTSSEDTKSSAPSKTTLKVVARKPAPKKRTAAKKARPSAVRSAAKKTVRKASRTAKSAVRQTATAATKTIDATTRAATSRTPADALQQFTSLFQQTPFKMEPLMNTKSFPQFDQLQSQMQSASTQYSNYMNKATAAAEKSRNRLASGMEECGKTVATLAQTNMQRANETVRALAACKSLNELADVQTRLFKQNYDAMTSETAKFIEQVTKCMTSASEPLNDLASESMKEAKKNLAA